MKKEDVYVVGIAGGSASGKTTIIEKLKKQFKDEIVMISHDFYYWPNDDKTLEEIVIKKGKKIYHRVIAL